PRSCANRSMSWRYWRGGAPAARGRNDRADDLSRAALQEPGHRADACATAASRAAKRGSRTGARGGAAIQSAAWLGNFAAGTVAGLAGRSPSPPCPRRDQGRGARVGTDQAGGCFNAKTTRIQRKQPPILRDTWCGFIQVFALSAASTAQSA